MSDCGIDGVKTDVQYMIDTWVSAKHRRELTETYLDSWIISALRYFSFRAISCMSQVPQLLFLQQLPHNRPAMLARNSDDFYPGIPDSHPWHLFANAHNTLLTQHLNILPDWDMFQTDHEFAGFHAAARWALYVLTTLCDMLYVLTAPSPWGYTFLRPHFHLQTAWACP